MSKNSGEDTSHSRKLQQEHSVLKDSSILPSPREIVFYKRKRTKLVPTIKIK